MLSAKALAATISTVPAYIEDVFSTYLYTGNGSTQTITNGVDLAGSGGLVWIKDRTAANSNVLFDTARGANKRLISNLTNAESTETDAVTAFTSSGFSIGASAVLNTSSDNLVSWTFRKQPKFFDVVTYMGDGGTGTRTISHSLGSTPGCVIVKKTNGTSSWYVQHRSIPATEILQLNATDGVNTDASFDNQYANSTSFYVRKSGGLNAGGATYVAYLFAHDAGGFGLSGTDNVISCGSYTGNGLQPGPAVTLGYEPQYVLIKAASTTGSWYIFDNMRGMTSNLAGANTNTLNANTSNAEVADSDGIAPTATGFTLTSASTVLNGSGSDYIYIAIRRGPMKVPTVGTSVYSTILQSPQSAGALRTVGFPADLIIGTGRTLSIPRRVNTRLVQFPSSGTTQNTLGTATNSTAAETTDYPLFYNVWNTTAREGDYNFMTSGVNWLFGRAPGFFDVVCYTGDGVNGRTITHNLAAAPELLIVKKRAGGLARAWFIYSALTGPSEYLRLNSTGATTSSGTFPWNSTSPTSSVFTVTNDDEVNGSGNTYVAYLFATVAGVSKVGSYTGTGTTLQVNCGFTGGARFVLIKRTDSTGDWYVWDSARGIVAGNDPYLLLNSTAAEDTGTDYVDTYSAGFEISSTAPAAINASGGSFIFLAVA